MFLFWTPLILIIHNFTQENTLRANDSIEKLKAFRLGQPVSSNQLCVLESGRVNFYGHMNNWVTRFSYKEYNNRITDAMEVLESLDASYSNYHATREKQQSVSSVIRET